MPPGRLSSVARQFTRNSAFGTVAGLLTALASVFAGVIVARALGVAGTGKVAFAMWVVSLAVATADLGVQATLARYLPELMAAERADAASRTTAMLWRWLACSSFASLTVFVGWAFYSSWMEKVSTADAVTWGLAGLACLLQAFTGLTFGYLRGIQRFDRLAALTGGFFVAQLAGVGFGSLYFGVPGAVAGYCLGSVVPAMASLRFARSPPLQDPELAARVRRYALYAWAGALSSTVVWSRVELLFLQHYSGNEPVGLFTVAVTLANLASQGPMLLTAGLLPYFATSFGKGATDEMRAAYAAATRVLSFIVLPLCFGLAALLPTVLPLVYGDAFINAVPGATVLVLAAGIAAATSVGDAVVMAMDRSDFFFVCGVASAILAVAAGLFVIPEYGLMGAVWSRAAVQLIAVAMAEAFLILRLGFPLPIADLTRLLLAASICGLTARAVLTLFSGALALAAAIAAGALSYLIAVRLLRALSPDDADRLRNLCGALPRQLGARMERLIELLAAGRRPLRMQIKFRRGDCRFSRKNKNRT